MSQYLLVHLLIAPLLVGELASFRSAAGQASAPEAQSLPLTAKLTDIEIRLDYETHGGCVGRRIKYQVVIRGDGVVEYRDLGGEPRDPFRQRTITADEVVALVNAFVHERFFEASASYNSEPRAVRNGDSIRLSQVGGVDGPEWNLTLRLGSRLKTVHLYMGFPTSLATLRDRVESIGGPKAWAGR